MPHQIHYKYGILYTPDDLTALFSEISVEQEQGVYYLLALYKGEKRVRERLLTLDAERFKKGDLPLESLLTKYCSYIVSA